MNTELNIKVNSNSFMICTFLALLATLISLSLLVFTAYSSGESQKEKMVMSAFGLLTVLGAHLLLALCRSAGFKVRFVSFLLWLFCMAYVVFNHASFFLSSQQQAGIQRVAAIDQSSLQSIPKRNLTEILTEQARVKTELVAKSQIHCDRNCYSLEVKLTRLKGTLEVLESEVDDFKRWQKFKDSQDEFKDVIRDDPLTTHLALWLGMTARQMELVRALLFAAILEGVACLCWYLVFYLRDSLVTHKVMPLVETTGRDTSAVINEVAAPASMLDQQVDELAKEVMTGGLKLTVKDIRDRCRCAQKKASDLKRLIEVRLTSLNQSC